MKLLEVFRLKSVKNDEVSLNKLRETISNMDSNQEIILKEALKILRFINKKYENFKPYLTGNCFSWDLKKDISQFSIALNRNKDLVRIILWKPSEDGADYQDVGIIPMEVLISEDWKKFTKEENLKIKNNYEIEKIEMEELNEVNKKKRDLEKFIELKKKFGVRETGEESNG